MLNQKIDEIITQAIDQYTLSKREEAYQLLYDLAVVEENDEACYWYGRIMEDGIRSLEMVPNRNEALKYFLISASQGNEKAINKLHYDYDNDEYFQKQLNYEDKGNAYYLQALDYQNKFDFVHAKDCLLQAAKFENSDAQFGLSQYYFYGILVEQDENEAHYWLKRAALFGNVDAKKFLSAYYGDKEKQVIGSGEKTFHMLIDTEEDDFQSDLSADELYHIGEDLYQESEFNQALPYIKKASLLGHAKAQCCFGRMYEQGWGLPIDERLALYWYRESAKQDDAHAQLILGNLYRDGECGVDEDLNEAMNWYLKAANQDQYTSQYILASNYYYGDTGEVDLKKALYWSKKVEVNPQTPSSILEKNQSLMEDILDEINDLENAEEMIKDVNLSIQKESMSDLEASYVREDQPDSIEYDIRQTIELNLSYQGIEQDLIDHPDFNLNLLIKEMEIDEDFYYALHEDFEMFYKVHVSVDKLIELATVGNISKYVKERFNSQKFCPAFEFDGLNYQMATDTLNVEKVSFNKDDNEWRIGVFSPKTSGIPNLFAAIEVIFNHQPIDSLDKMIQKVEGGYQVSFMIQDKKIVLYGMELDDVGDELCDCDYRDLLLLNDFVVEHNIQAYLLLHYPLNFYSLTPYMLYLKMKNIQCFGVIQPLFDMNNSLVDDGIDDIIMIKLSFKEINVKARDLPYVNILLDEKADSAQVITNIKNTVEKLLYSA